MRESLFELFEDLKNLEKARMELIQNGQRDNAVLKEALSCVGSDNWVEIRRNLLENLDKIYRHMDWGKSLGHGIYAKELFRGIPELYESLPLSERQEIDKVFCEQPDIHKFIERMEWNVLDFLKSEAGFEFTENDVDND